MRRGVTNFLLLTGKYKLYTISHFIFPFAFFHLLEHNSERDVARW